MSISLMSRTSINQIELANKFKLKPLLNLIQKEGKPNNLSNLKTVWNVSNLRDHLVYFTDELYTSKPLTIMSRNYHHSTKINTP